MSRTVKAGDLGAVVGFAGLTAGLSWAFFAHYRDKGYGMGHRVGFLAGGRGEQKRLRSYLTRRLPAAARPPRCAIVAQFAHTAFFGFFFVNFVVEKATGSPLVTF